jgi:hypothetical protein
MGSRKKRVVRARPQRERNMSSRAVVLAVLFLMLLFILPAIAFAGTAASYTESMNRRLGEKSKPAF